MDQVWQKFTNFLRPESFTSIFFKTLINKTSNFRSNLGHWSSGIFFEVLHTSLAQKLANLEFLTMIFCHDAIGQFVRSLRPIYWPHQLYKGIKWKLKIIAFIWDSDCLNWLVNIASIEAYILVGHFDPTPVPKQPKKSGSSRLEEISRETNNKIFAYNMPIIASVYTECLSFRSNLTALS